MPTVQGLWRCIFAILDHRITISNILIIIPISIIILIPILIIVFILINTLLYPSVTLMYFCLVSAQEEKQGASGGNGG